MNLYFILKVTVTLVLAHSAEGRLAIIDFEILNLGLIQVHRDSLDK